MTTTEPDTPPTPEPAQPAPVLDEQAIADLRKAVEEGLAAMRLPEEGSVVGNTQTGEVTIVLSGRVLTLPRPTFGQIRRLIRAEEHLASRLKNIDYRSQAFLNKSRADIDALPGDAGPGQFEVSLENIPALEQIRNDARDRADLIEDELVGELVAWWTLVFSTLAESEVSEDDWPADLIDPGLPARVIAHWRRNPVGPG